MQNAVNTRLLGQGGGYSNLSAISSTGDDIKVCTRPILKKSAFTLAEVLVTLGVIGIVAAMTLPSIIASYKKQVAETRLKHTYSIITQAIKLVEAEHGMGFKLEVPVASGADINGYSWDYGRDAYEIYFKKHIPAKVVWDNKNESTKHKFYFYGNYKSGARNFPAYAYYFELGNGVLLGLQYHYGSGRLYFPIILNKNAKQVVAGRDIFGINFDLTKDGYRNIWFDRQTEQQLQNNCSTYSYQLLQSTDQRDTCFELIRRNSFNIPKTYPIPF